MDNTVTPGKWIAKLICSFLVFLMLPAFGCFAHARQFAINCAHECTQTYGVLDGENIQCRAKCFFKDCTATCIIPPGHPYKDGFPVQAPRH